MDEMTIVDKIKFYHLIIEKLQADHDLLLHAASSAHAAATHAENIPDSKYETLSIEADYIAQGQANRAQEILINIEIFRALEPKSFAAHSAIRLGALVLLEDEKGQQRQVFLGPVAGGMKLHYAGADILVITPESPLGQNLLGKKMGDDFEFQMAGKPRAYEILRVS